jgi:hypothetical protein
MGMGNKRAVFRRRQGKRCRARARRNADMLHAVAR